MLRDDSLDLKRREFLQAGAAITGGTALAIGGSAPTLAADGDPLGTAVIEGTGVGGLKIRLLAPRGSAAHENVGRAGSGGIIVAGGVHSGTAAVLVRRTGNHDVSRDG